MLTVANKLHVEAETITEAAVQDKHAADILLVTAQTDHYANLETESIATSNFTDKRALTEVQAAALTSQQRLESIAKESLLLLELDTETSKKNLVNSQVTLTIAQVATESSRKTLTDRQANTQTNEALRVVADTTRLAADTTRTNADKLFIDAKTQNSASEKLVLDNTACKLQAEFDVLVEQKAKAISETDLLTQKTITETAHTDGTGINASSVFGKQNALYSAQADGFTRDAEQKVGKLFFDTWNVRRTTDEATVADGTNKLNDANIGYIAQVLLDGVNAGP